MRRFVLLTAFCLAVGCGADPGAVVPLDGDVDDETGADSSTGDAADAALGDASETSADASSEDAADAPPAKTKTVLRVHYPAGTKTVTLRGSTAPWTWEKGAAMTAGEGDTWTLETDALTADAEWKPLLDDSTWSRGPNYKVKVGTTVDVWPHFVTVKGKVEKRWPAFASTALSSTRGVWVYYPPTYLENARARFPVVYMHDGQNLFDPSLAFGGNEWKVDETMDAAAEDGSIREAIVVGPENTSQRIYEYTPTSNASYSPSGGGDLYLKLLVDELKPKVDSELRTLTARESTVIIGSSLGGLISAYAGTKKAATFGLIGAMSPSTWWDGKAILGLVSASKDAASHPLKVYVDSGDSGSSSDDMANTKLLADAYRSIGYVDDVTLKYVVQKGATHSEVYWAQRLPGALSFLLGAR
ncbi:MAG: alpha/beta hydrolase [Deltaproteobacteria bacterium]|nr:alpha/beta hydrolase [Deltaproteobacteria bacterium]